MPSARQSTSFTTFGEKKLSRIIAARNCHHHCRHCLFGYQWFLALLMAETAKTMVRWSMSLINLHRRYFERRPASPLVPSRHMKLSLDDLKALQEHLKDLLMLKDLKKLLDGMRPIWCFCYQPQHTKSLLITIISTWIPSLPQNVPSQQTMLSECEKGRQNVFLAAASRAKHRHIDRWLPLYRHCCQVRATLALPHLWSCIKYVYIFYARFCSQTNFFVD